MDAFGNVTRTTHGNGATTTRTFDPKTGRPTGIGAAAKSGTKIRDNAYAWRSDGLLASRASHIGGKNANLEEFYRDPLGRLTKAATKLGGVAKRTQTYDAGQPECEATARYNVSPHERTGLDGKCPTVGVTCLKAGREVATNRRS